MGSPVQRWSSRASWLRALVAVMATLLGGGCAPGDEARRLVGSPKVVSITHEHAGAATTCLDAVATDPMDWPKGCSERLCFAPRWSVTIATRAGESLDCSTALAEQCARQTDQGGFFFRGIGDDGRSEIEVGFDNQLGGHFGDAGVGASFGALYVSTLYARGSDGRIAHLANRRLEPGDLKSLEFHGGRLRASAEFVTTEIDYSLAHIDPDCGSELLLRCDCAFRPLTIVTELVLDLALAPTR